MEVYSDQVLGFAPGGLPDYHPNAYRISVGTAENVQIMIGECSGTLFGYEYVYTRRQILHM
jgi:hypothetical protein